MIVTPEGLNVFPEDVERVLNHLPGVRDSAVVGVPTGGEERVHAVLVLDAGIDPDAVVREANAQLDDHQKIRRGVVWPERGTAADGRHAEAEARRDPRVGEERRARRRPRPKGATIADG